MDKGDRVQQGQLSRCWTRPNSTISGQRARDLQLRPRYRQAQPVAAALAVIRARNADQSHAQMLEAQENLDQLAMQAYKEIRAPFDGIVTARYVDPGD